MLVLHFSSSSLNLNLCVTYSRSFRNSQFLIFPVFSVVMFFFYSYLFTYLYFSLYACWFYLCCLWAGFWNVGEFELVSGWLRCQACSDILDCSLFLSIGYFLMCMSFGKTTLWATFGVMAIFSFLTSALIWGTNAPVWQSAWFGTLVNWGLLT